MTFRVYTAKELKALKTQFKVVFTEKSVCVFDRALMKGTKYDFGKPIYLQTLGGVSIRISEDDIEMWKQHFHKKYDIFDLHNARSMCAVAGLERTEDNVEKYL